MSSANFILAINFSVGVFFTAAFALIAHYGRAYRTAKWFALAYAVGSVIVVTEMLLPFGQFMRVLYVTGFAAYLSALLLFIVGISKRAGVQPPWALLGWLFVVPVVINTLLFDLPHESGWRLLGYQFPLTVVQLVAAYQIVRHGMDDRIARITGMVLALGSANYLVKPVLAYLLGGSGDSSATYLATSYAAWSQTMGGILAISGGLMFILIYVRDILADIRTESETDELSGLLNRRGFDTHVRKLLATYGDAHMPAAVVVADLDGFKRINDSYGHAAGDGVIKAFSGLLQRMARDDHVAARIGGEEFAVFLPVANEVSARLFAEGVRSRFAALRVSELPAGEHATASFGIAGVRGTDTLGSLMRRADAALYNSKHNGRNQVSLAHANEMSHPRTRRRA